MPTFSGNFITAPEGGAEYGVDYGAPGLLGAPVVSPVAGTVIGYQPSSGGSPGWDPGRLLIQAVDGTIVGIGHITSTLKPGTVLQAGQSVGSVGNSSFYGGTAESNAHIEVMSGTSTSTFKSGGQAKVLVDQALAILALPGGPPGGLPQAAPSGGQTTTTTNQTKSLSQLISDTPGTGAPIIGPLVTGLTFPVTLTEWITQRGVWARGMFILVGAGITLYGIHLLTRDGGSSPVVNILSKGKSAAAAVAS